MAENSLVKLDQATRMLAEIRTIDDAKDLIDLAEAARVYAKQVELGLEAQNHAAEIKLRAQRRAGEILSQIEGQPGTRTDLLTSVDPLPRLKQDIYNETGINKFEAHQWQTIAKMPELAFEKFIGETTEDGKELTTAGIYKTQREELRRQDLRQQKDDIDSGVTKLPDGVFEIISLDPPWPYGTEYDPQGRRAANPYPEMSLEEIQDIELPTAQDCILWLWTTHKFMRHSFGLLDTWGFRDVSILTWEKDRIGLGSWLRSKSEFCIMSVRGSPKVLLTNQTTVLHGAMREHSRKPEEFYQLVDSLCIGRKLDYFSREERPGWFSYGNDANKFNME